MRITFSGAAVFFSAIVLAVCGVPSSAHAQGATYKIVAFSGQSSPGGGTFEQFQPPVLAADGTVGFVGMSFRDSLVQSAAIFAGTSGGLRRVVSLGDPVPDTPDATFLDFGPISLSGDGSVGFNADVSIGESSSRGIWSEGEDGLGASSEEKPLGFKLQTLGDVAFRSGIVFAKGNVLPTEEGFSQESLGALLRNVSGNFEKLLIDGDTLDGHVVKSIFYDDNYVLTPGRSVDVNESGSIVMKVNLTPQPMASPSPSPVPQQAIYAGSPTAPKLVAVMGDPVPGLPDQTYGSFLTNPSISADGHVAFSTLFGSGPFSAILAGFPGAIAPVVASGADVPTTTDVFFEQVMDCVINSTGDVIFRARIRYPAPGHGSRIGLWVQRRTGPPVLLAIDGMTLDTPGGPQEVSWVDFAGPGTFNDLHEFVFMAEFAGGQQGIYLADTRPGAPDVNVTRPRKPRDFVTTDATVDVFGTATDDTGIEKVEYTVAREVSADHRKKNAKKKKPRKWIVSRVKLARGDENWHFKVPLDMGLNLISVVATDKLGNQSEPYKVRMLRYDPDDEE